MVAVVGDLFFAKGEGEGVGGEDGFGEGLVEADLLHVAGVFNADVGNAEQPAHLGSVHGAVAQGKVGFKGAKYPEHLEVESQQTPYFAEAALIGFPEGDEVEIIGLQQIDSALLLTTGEEDGMTIVLQLLCQVTKDVNVCGVTKVDECFH